MAVSLNGKTYWLVGASEGLGRALAHELTRAGTCLCLSARNVERLETLARELPLPATGEHIAAPCDIPDSESVATAFTSLPPIDGVIINAGVYEPVSATAWDAEAVEAMCNVNFTGTARVLGQAMQSGRFRTDFPRRFAWRFRLARLLPDALFFRLVQ